MMRLSMDNARLRRFVAWGLAGVFPVLWLLAPLRAAHAQEWPLAAIQVTDGFASEARYLYVGKGEVWEAVQYSVDYLASSEAFLAVSLDGQVLHTQYLSGQGSLRFPLPNLQAGFHRLDFAFTQRGQLARPEDGSLGLCASSDSATVLRDGGILYRPSRPQGYQLRDLPDALFNPRIQGDVPSFTGHVRINRNDPDELTAIARLASSWTADAPVHWLDAEQAVPSGGHFGVELEHAPALQEQAHISLGADVPGQDISSVSKNQASSTGNDAAARPAPSGPVLRIRYRDATGLQNAVQALLNPQYLAQLHASHARITDRVEPPRWAGLRAIQSLADLGVQDVRLDGNSHGIQLVFPGAWQPVDVLHGQLALTAQNGLLPGSRLSLWLDGALAGSINLSPPPASTGTRTLNFQAPRASGSTSFDLRLETALITNGECLPRSRGALWIDASKSTITLPHQLKSGVAGISAALVPRPTVQVDGSPGSLGIAIALLQTTKRMLLDGQPVPARIATARGQAPDVNVNVVIDPELYRQRVAMHSHKIYGPYASNGVMLSHEENRFHVIAQNPASAVNFARHWPGIQSSLPDNAREVLLAQDGKPIVLSQFVASTQVTPAMRPSTITMLGGVVLAALLAIAGWWLWRSRRSRKRPE